MKNTRKACAFVLGAALFAPVLASAQNNIPGQQQPGQQATPAAMPTPAAQPAATPTPTAQPAVAAAPAQPSYKTLVAKKKALLQQRKARRAKLAQDKKALNQQEQKEIQVVRSDKTLSKTQKNAKIAAIRKSYADRRKGMWSDFKKDMGGIGSDIAGVGRDMEFWRSHHKKATKIAKKHKTAVKTNAGAAPASAQ